MEFFPFKRLSFFPPSLLLKERRNWLIRHLVYVNNLSLVILDTALKTVLWSENIKTNLYLAQYFNLFSAWMPCWILESSSFHLHLLYILSKIAPFIFLELLHWISIPKYVLCTAKFYNYAPCWKALGSLPV